MPMESTHLGDLLLFYQIVEKYESKVIASMITPPKLYDPILLIINELACIF